MPQNAIYNEVYRLLIAFAVLRSSPRSDINAMRGLRAAVSREGLASSATTPAHC